MVVEGRDLGVEGDHVQVALLLVAREVASEGLPVGQDLFVGLLVRHDQHGLVVGEAVSWTRST